MGELIFLGVLFAIAVYAAFMLLSKRGRAFMFGGKIVKTWDGVKGKRKIVTTKVKVHAVDASPSLRFVGLELTATTVGSYQMLPISLPKTEALELARLIQEAAAYQHNDSEI